MYAYAWCVCMHVVVSYVCLRMVCVCMHVVVSYVCLRMVCVCMHVAVSYVCLRMVCVCMHVVSSYACLYMVCKHKLLSGLFSNECMGGREGGAGQQWWYNICWVSTL